jgi:YHS domain-containing protein
MGHCIICEICGQALGDYITLRYLETDYHFCNEKHTIQFLTNELSKTEERQ